MTDLHLRRLDSGLGFLLKGVDDPNISADLNSVDDPESVPSMPERDFEHAAVNALERLGFVRFTVPGSYRERV